MTTLGLAILAGLLTSLSPCVLAALPIVVGSASSRHRAGPVAIVVGMVGSFVVIGVLLASFGAALALDGGAIRIAGAVGLLFAGAATISERLQAFVARRLAPLASWASGGSSRIPGTPGLVEHVGVGALLGAVWSPCSGPTMGAAVGLAIPGGVPRAALVMTVFGIGAAIPLLGAAYATRAFRRHADGLRGFARRSRPFFGATIFVVGVAVLFGLDRRIESGLLDALPDAWVDLVSRY